VHLKGLFYFIYNEPLWLHLSQKKIMIFWYSSNFSIFYEYGTMALIFQGIFWMHILPIFLAWVELLFIFWFLQELRCLLWFISINLISCGASPNTNVLMIFYLFLVCNGPFGWPITQKKTKNCPMEDEWVHWGPKPGLL
jgi:hypothetical protein